MTTRRLFLLGAASLIAAPAIVRAESLMKIVVPRRDLIQWRMVDIEALRRNIEAANARIGQGIYIDSRYYQPPMVIFGADWPSRTIKAPPGGFKIART